eukprot:TRINITY_DN3696_c0_g1_i2.p2 TRINITY_DN3696_c0_g1~~TRINITY_DN3696_c0_g1_i2.p2  ORF type:complete len:329 (+),score=63.26 TRINITY_DN3696_c0_g1_i2:131-988(+)
MAGAAESFNAHEHPPDLAGAALDFFVRYMDFGVVERQLCGGLQLSAVARGPGAFCEAVRRADLITLTRSQDITFHADHPELAKLFDKRARLVPLPPVMESVGSSTFVFATSYVAEPGGPPLVTTRVGRVSVDSTLKARAPFPQHIRDLAPASATAPRVLPPVPPRPAGAFCWRTVARHTETDMLGHVNQSHYGLYVEEARAVAAAAGAYSGGGARVAGRPPRRAALDYVGQAVPGDELAVHTWWDGEAFRFEIEKELAQGKPQLLIRASIWPRTAAEPAASQSKL